MLSISVVSMGNANNLIPCIESILQNIKLSQYEILINAFNYTENEKIRVTNWYNEHQNDSIHLLFTYGIRGYSANHNLNLKVAKYNIFCILNDDTYVDNDIFSPILSIMDDPSIAVCTPVIKNFDGSIQYLYRKKVSPFFNIINHVKIDKLLPFLDVYERDTRVIKDRKIIDIPYALGVCFFVKKEKLNNGLLDETFFLGPDDLYWNYLIKSSPRCNRIILVSEAYIFHKGHDTISNYLYCSIPVQTKGMMRLFELMGYKITLYKFIFFPLLIGHLIVNEIAYFFSRSKRALLVKSGYCNAIKVYWKNTNNLNAIFRFFYSRLNNNFRANETILRYNSKSSQK